MALARELHIPRVYSDYQELIACEDIQAVTIATPNHMHHPIALAALRAGKHVFCEKPLAMNKAQAREIWEEARKAGRHHQIAFLFRYLYGIQKMHALIARGAIGRIFYVRVEGGSPGELMPGARFNWRHDREQAGTGMVGDVGSHYLDIVRMAAGEITSVCGQTVILSRNLPDPATGTLLPVTTDDLASVLFEVNGGIQGQLLTGRICPQRHYADLELYGEKGGMRCTLSRGELDRVEIALQGEPYHPVPLPEGQTAQPGRCMKEMMHRFVDICLGNLTKEGRDADFEDGYRVQEAIDAVVRSVKERRWVKTGS